MIYNKENLEIVSKVILDNLTPDLLPKKWRERNSLTPSFGHCHNASACLQKVFGTKNIKLQRALDDEEIWHWWCIDIDGKRIDLTSDQYFNFNRTPPYDQGERVGMLGWSYKTRVLTLLDRVQKILSTKDCVPTD